MTLPWEMIGEWFTSINLLNFGYELLPLAFSVILAVCFSKSKRDFGIGFVLIYLATFIIGWAHEVWILVVTALIAGIYTLKSGSGE